jgi:hypothetical protein
MAASRTVLRLLCLGAPVLLLVGGQAVRADELAFGDTAVRSASEAEFHAELQRLQIVVAACAANAKDCDAQPPEDERVGVGTPEAFEMHWGWLRTALEISKTAKPEDRARYMREAQAQLEAMERETGPASAPPHDEFAKARSAANDVLRAPEFAGDGSPTWLSRKFAQLQNMIARFFDGVNDLGSAAPWLGKLLEWLLFVSAAVGLLVFLLRTLARQRLRLALGEAAAVATAWDREATGWAQLAEAHAAAAEWREAVHCLYWAAIVLLESRRAWRHNPTRTPREYVRLLKPGSARQQGLRGLTQSFERIWYGQQEATAEDYLHAQSCFLQLESAAEASAPTTTASAAGVTA